MTGDGSEAALTDCAEVVTSRLAAAIDLPAAECRLAIRDGEPGLISRNVTPHGFNLNTGTTDLPEVEGYQRRPSAGSDSDGGRMRLDEPASSRMTAQADTSISTALLHRLTPTVVMISDSGQVGRIAARAVAATAKSTSWISPHRARAAPASRLRTVRVSLLAGGDEDRS